MSGTESALDLPRLLDTAGAVLDDAVEIFVDGLGAPSAVYKGGKDFATQVDLDIERRITAQLEDRTQIPVHGEEFGGADPVDGPVWVLDPVDGTFNYSAGMPLTGILLGLVVDGEATLGLTWLPLLGRKYAAHADGPLLVNGEAVEPPPDLELEEAAIAYGSFNAKGGGRYAGDRRADLLSALSSRVARIRMTGSTGVDMAFTASGVFGGAIAFSRHPWDNAAGAALVRAAGGVATDIAGNRWTVTSPSLVAGRPGVHAGLMRVIRETVGEWSESPDL
ncbi:inositol monophosphatase family protein [Gordonia paraffinivorans]|uniref:inositol-phosphate phosphatase n=1 Tax=Gordonia paraffinivorans TaxID=175628 RepID=A0ABD7UX27_9ACTN|nr:inositol monophosphatase family protein [Gordonia paraffinivorans]MBY4575082.1 inositol monophosphatase [Gordonia paraffinivorans]MCD2146554.1 inositol monophosphatase family protein [Gordonia paraffinivorans]PWD41979.1 inositol monophosphatase [Gordonia paraffinivorans]VFA80920.1 Inositol-1-monophosphatase ImpA [Gordonia paraffinivorans]